MKLLKSLFFFFVVAAIAIALITMRPTKADFAEYYVSQNQTGFGSFFDEAFEKIVMQRTEVKEYLVFSVFEVDGEDRYVGILGHFFGRSSSEQAAQTMGELIEQARKALEEKQSDRN